MSIETVPAGRGTTPNGTIAVYKNGDIIRSSKYFTININSTELKKAFSRVDKVTLDNIVSSI